MGRQLPGAVLFLTMPNLPFENLAAYATEDRIIRLIAKERGKYTAKNGGTSNPFRTDPLFNELKSMCPPHKLWSDPGRGKLPKKATHGLARWTSRKKRASVRVYQAIRKNMGVKTDAAWIKNLQKFVNSIRESIVNPDSITLESPQILSKYKEQDKKTGDFIFRPICKCSDLKTKIILSLTYHYIIDKFDGFFHRNMLFMRAPRRVNDSEYQVPKFLDAIDLVSRYRIKNNGSPIYVGECDIQKFYDILNHDVIMDCFEDLFNAAMQRYGAVNSDFDALRSIIRSYLASYNYPDNVMIKNGDRDFWKSEIRHRKNDMNPDPVCRFKWVAEDEFISAGCYGKDDFNAAKSSGKLGIPQGGALSGIIVNVVMRVVDKPIVSPDDDQRLFIRYCDDILLMHTDREQCVKYLDTYYNQLIGCKLVPHRRKDVAECKNGVKTRSDFWRQKSKNVYLWGPGKGDASDWIAFVGYEMRRTGEIRVRKDKIDAEFKRIASRYYDIIYSKAVKSGVPLSGEQQDKLMSRMDSLADHILDYEKAGNNLYTRSQARRLDKYLYRKSHQAAGKIGIADPVLRKSAARKRVTYLQKVKEK